MKRPDEEFALLLEGINGIEAGMVSSLLEAEGIPSMKHGPDFDVAEFGQAAHDMLRGTTLLVPRSALERARRLLGEAGWSGEEGAIAEQETPASERGRRERAVVRALLLAMTVGFITLSLVGKMLVALVAGATALLVYVIACAITRP